MRGQTTKLSEVRDQTITLPKQLNHLASDSETA